VSSTFGLDVPVWGKKTATAIQRPTHKNPAKIFFIKYLLSL
jgi:hypothetical protein